MKVVIIGSGAFGTALGSALSKNRNLEVFLISRNLSQVEQINKKNKNTAYLDGKKLSKRLTATSDLNTISGSDFAMLALPSNVVGQFVEKNRNNFQNVGCIVNLSKGFGTDNGILIPDTILRIMGVDFPVASIKGPTFAHDLLSSPTSAFSLASTHSEKAKLLKKVFKGANIKTDYGNSIHELEYLSILKNVYAIAMGVIEAKYSNPNLRAAIFTDSLRETRVIASFFLGQKVDVLKYAGIGDILLTGLNDQSRNRTLGLMIGKTFLNPTSTNNGVVVEGVRSIRLIKDKLPENVMSKLKIFSALVDLMELKINAAEFLKKIIKN